MTPEETAREIVVKCFHEKFINDECSIYYEGWFDINPVIAAIRSAREESIQIGIKNKCKLIAEAREQAREECAKIADIERRKFDCGDKGYIAANNIALSIRKRKERQ